VAGVTDVPGMTGSPSMAEIARALVEDPAYVALLTARIAARTEDRDVIDRLIAYARSRQATRGQAIARRVLTDAGVSWESL
jgi:hypothetical protein